MKKRTRQPDEKTTPRFDAANNRQGQAANLLILAGILLTASILRFAMLESTPPGLCFDEAMNGVNFMEAIQTGSWRTFYEDNNGREGLFINAQGAFVWLQMQVNRTSANFHIEPWMLRFPSAVFGSFTVLGLYLLALKMTSSRFVSASAALFLATSFWHVNFSRIGFRAISAPCFLVWSLWLLWSGFMDLQGSSRRSGLVKLAAAGLTYGAGFHSYIAFRITVLIVLAALILFARELAGTGRLKKFLLGAAVFAASAVLAVTPLAIYFLQNPASFGGRSAQVSALSAPDPLRVLAENSLKTALMFNYAGDTFWRHNIAGKAQLSLPVGALFLCGIGFTAWRGASRLSRQVAIPGGFAIVWLVAGAIPVILAGENVPHALRGILMVPACCLLAAVGAQPLWSWLQSRFSRTLASACAALVAAILIWQCYAAYFVEFARTSQLNEAFDVEWVNFAQEINSAPAVADKYVVVPGGSLDRRGVPPHLYSLALLTNAYNAKARSESRVHFIVDRTEAERASAEPGAQVFLVQQR